MELFNSFTFDNLNSLDYGVYITGSAVWNAPERVLEMISIPGRNGALALDQGRYENIEVTYPAGIFCDSMEDFAEKIRAFRNVLCSRYAYVKITDTYNPDEYRVGLYRSGLEVDAVHYNSAAEFDITFECKPQRFLKSGDEAIPLHEGVDVLTNEALEAITNEAGVPIEVNAMIASFTNPTDYPSRPLIVVPGPGYVQFGDQQIVVSGDGSLPVYIDCDIMEAYTVDETGKKTNANNIVSFSGNDFPVFPPGENTFSASVENVELYPRWWIL